VPGWRRFDEARAARSPVVRWKKGA
jgi:hypothetical protein